MTRQTAPDLLGAEAVDRRRLVAARVSGDDTDRASRDVQHLRKERLDLLVRAAFLRRRCHGDAQRSGR